MRPKFNAWTMFPRFSRCGTAFADWLSGKGERERYEN
jgi:hypothetical protein